ncbi:hypothetical protein ACTXT7_005013 [Hymenolepis weldensis]
MAFVSVLAVFGSNGTENKSDKFQKLFYDGLVTALGSYASDVDAIVATSSPITDLMETEKYSSIRRIPPPLPPPPSPLPPILESAVNKVRKSKYLCLSTGIKSP